MAFLQVQVHLPRNWTSHSGLGPPSYTNSKSRQFSMYMTTGQSELGNSSTKAFLSDESMLCLLTVKAN